MEWVGEKSQFPKVLVAVLCAGSGRLEASVLSLLGQDYPDLEVILVDVSGSAGVHSVATSHGLRVIASSKGKGVAPAANAVLYEPVDHFEWIVFCHDDTALEPDAIRVMIETAIEMGAAIVGPKVRDWRHPTLLREVGFGCDRYGYCKSQVDPGETDRGQHDLLRDTFFVSTTCMAVRLDVMAALGGFDASLDSFEEDLDLCWRARLLGHKVIVAPGAVAYHDPDRLDFPPVKDPDFVAARHRMQIITKCYRPMRLIATLLLLLAQDVAEVGFRAVTGRPPRLLQKVSLWLRYLLGLGSLLRSRAAVQRSRVIQDSELAQLQTSGSLRIRSALERQIHRESLEGEAGSAHPLQGTGSGVWEFLLHELTRAPVVFWIIWVFFVLIACRNILFSRSVPITGELGVFHPGLSTLREYISGWQPDGVGSFGYPLPAKLIAGLAQMLVFGRPVAPLKVFLPVAFLTGSAGAWTLVRRVSGPSRWEGAAAATLLYGLSAPVVGAYERGSLSGIVCAALMPWALALVCNGLFGAKGNVRSAALLAVLVFVMTSFEPSAPLLVLSAALGIVLGSVFAGKFLRSLASLLFGAVGASVGALLAFPWAVSDGAARDSLLEVLSGWSDGRIQLGVGGVLRMQTTGIGSAPLGYFLAGLAIIALVLCKGDRLGWVARLLFAGAIPAAGVWLAGQGKLPAVIESFPAVFTVSGVAFSAAAGLGLDGLLDRGAEASRGKALARVVVWPVATAVLLAAGPGLIHEIGGDLGIRSTGIEKSLEDPRSASGEGPVSVLWVGSEESLPGNPRPIPGGGGGAYSVTEALPLPALARMAPHPENFEKALERVITQLKSEGFTRGGKLLAMLGIRYVAIPSSPGVFPVGSKPPPTEVVEGLSRQLDMQEIRGLRGIRLFRVKEESAIWTAAAVDRSVTEAAKAAGDAGFRRWLDVELTGVAPVFESVALGERDRVDASVFRAIIVFKDCEAGFALAAREPNGKSTVIDPREVFGWACMFELPDRASRDGQLQVELVERDHAEARRWAGVQLAGLLVVLLIAMVARSRKEERYVPERLAARGEVEELISSPSPPESTSPSPESVGFSPESIEASSESSAPSPESIEPSSESSPTESPEVP